MPRAKISVLIISFKSKLSYLEYLVFLVMVSLVFLAFHKLVEEMGLYDEQMLGSFDTLDYHMSYLIQVFVVCLEA